MHRDFRGRDIFLSRKDTGDRTGDLAGDKRLAPARGLMVEENPVGRKEVVAFPVVPGHPVGIDLRAGIGTAGVEGGLLTLGRMRSAEHFAR